MITNELKEGDDNTPYQTSLHLGILHKAQTYQLDIHRMRKAVNDFCWSNTAFLVLRIFINC